MEINEQISLLFRGVDFPSINLSSFKPFAESDDNKVVIKIDPRAFIPSESSNTFKIVMEIHLSSEEHFTLSITAVGTFELKKEESSVSKEITEAERKTLINANSTAIMFPYVRSFIATLTSNLGKVTTPIILPVRFFKGDYIDETSKDFN